MALPIVLWPEGCRASHTAALVGWRLHEAIVVLDALDAEPNSLPASVRQLELLHSPSRPALSIVSIDPLRLCHLETRQQLLIVLYRPPDVQAHRMLSLDAFSFETDKKPKTASVEEEMLSATKAKLSSLDLGRTGVPCVDLHAVVDLVRRAPTVHAGPTSPQLNETQAAKGSLRHKPASTSTATRSARPTAPLPEAILPFELLQSIWSTPSPLLNGNSVIDLVATGELALIWHACIEGQHSAAG
jgi:hypothetical protein